MAIWGNYKSRVVALFILRPEARATIALPAFHECGVVECIDVVFAGCIKGYVHMLL